jgi:drug/metabolite transporter (DMT)-like permease
LKHGSLLNGNWCLFGETLNLVQIIGMAVTAAAVIIVNRRAPSR